MFDPYQMLVNVLFTGIAITVTWLIARWYRQKPSKVDLHFESEKERALEDLKHRAGHTFSVFKEKCNPILKKRIYEQDIVAFAHKFEDAIEHVENTSKYVQERESYYLRYLTIDEYNHHTFFFNQMLRFIRTVTLTIERTSDTISKDECIKEELKRINKDLEEIKSREIEYEGISHIITATLCMPQSASSYSKRIKCFKSSCLFH